MTRRIGKAESSPVSADSFSNPIDPLVGYARGRVLRSHDDEVLRMLHGRRTVAARVADGGLDSVYNLTGVTRAFPLSTSDVQGISTQLAFYANYDERAEPFGVAYAGGSSGEHSACFATRVSAAFLATMLALLDHGDDVLSAIPRGRSHPSVQNAVRVAGGRFEECVGLDSALDTLRISSPRMVVITTITPQKHAFEEAEILMLMAAIDPSRTMIVLDDAHAAVRMAFFQQSPPLGLGHVDLAICSMDKHLWGPRAALIVGRHETLKRVRTAMYRLGVEAPFATYVASMRAIEGFDPQRIEQAGSQADELQRELVSAFPRVPFYTAGPGVALQEEDLLRLVVGQGGADECELVPMEISSLVAMELIRRHGFVTILGIGMPGSAAALRIMPYPDGKRAGTQAIASGIVDAVATAGESVGDVSSARALITGA